MMKITFIKPFKEGFFGAFSLAIAIVVAVAAVASSFAAGNSPAGHKDNGLHHT